jgi:hypothetical protein
VLAKNKNESAEQVHFRLNYRIQVSFFSPDVSTRQYHIIFIFDDLLNNYCFLLIRLPLCNVINATESRLYM